MLWHLPLFSPDPNILSLFDRRSVDEEVTPLDDGPSDDEILANTSEEEDDSSSISSKGEAEPAEESTVRGTQLDLWLHSLEVLTNVFGNHHTGFALCKVWSVCDLAMNYTRFIYSALKF